MKVIARTDVGLVRRTNEDSYSVDLSNGLFVVADGMGGHEAGEVASALAVQAIEICWQLQVPGSDPTRVLIEACKEANRRIYRESLMNPKWTGMGTTLTAAYLANGAIVIAHVGDSRAYMYRDGSVRLLTRDHSLVEEMVRQGTITEAEAQEHPQRNVITRALGTRDEVQVDIFIEAWNLRDVLLLCTDGLTNLVSADEIGKLLFANGSHPYQEKAIERVADRLMALALERGGHDNVTFLIIWQEESEGCEE